MAFGQRFVCLKHYVRATCLAMLVAVLLCFASSCRTAAPTSTTTLTTPNGTIYIPISTKSLHTKNVTITPLSHFPRHAYRVDVTAGAGVTVLTPKEQKLVKASIQARKAKCTAAVNGGPFHADGSSVGVLVTNGRVRQTDPHAEQLVGVGLVVVTSGDHGDKRIIDDHADIINGNSNNVTIVPQQPRPTSTTHEKQHSYWVLGAPPVQLHNVQFFVTGFDWLVFQGVNLVDKDTTGALRAPRTAVGVTASGEDLVFFVADGCERCLRKRGLNLHELADHLINDLGLEYAINLDGGSSTVLIDSWGEVENHPTCLDVVPHKCERPVATVFCLGHQQGETRAYRIKRNEG